MFVPLLLNQLLEDNIITEDEWISFKKKLKIDEIDN